MLADAIRHDVAFIIFIFCLPLHIFFADIYFSSPCHLALVCPCPLSFFLPPAPAPSFRPPPVRLPTPRFHGPSFTMPFSALIFFSFLPPDHSAFALFYMRYFARASAHSASYCYSATRCHTRSREALRCAASARCMRHFAAAPDLRRYFAQR